ncbi:hypothetical protein [Cellulomonas fimi]|uniref:Uncharacterized protein n=1 Tax=Cellulomonas fimi TaxID=1708 RepID=A0A7Y0QHW7_CELFI|nr:hypothetical protein [Cellulomonas fimi]NMR20309.1 hypothetical protein [Cellulomonas fimi]
MDRTHVWGRRLLSGAFVALAALGFRYAVTGDEVDLLAGAAALDRVDCTVDDLSVEYSVDYVAELGGYGVSAARVSAPEDCRGATVSVTFTGAEGRALGRATGVVREAPTVLHLHDGGQVPAADIEGLAVVLLG